MQTLTDGGPKRQFPNLANELNCGWTREECKPRIGRTKLAERVVLSGFGSHGLLLAATCAAGCEPCAIAISNFRSNSPTPQQFRCVRTRGRRGGRRPAYSRAATVRWAARDVPDRLSPSAPDR